MAYIPDAACIAAARAAAGDALGQQEILDAFERVHAYKQRLEAAGDPTGREARLRAFAANEAERTKVAAALARKHAAMNIIVRDKLEEHIGYMLKAGMSPRGAMLAILEGSPRAVRNARTSTAAFRAAYARKYLGGVLKEIHDYNPSLVKALDDRQLNRDIFTEMTELRDGGTPGSTGNKDAQFIAKTFAKWADAARLELNRLGASIGKLDGWAGVQVHDTIKMLKVKPEVWAGRILPLLDIERTFPEGLSERETMDALEDIYKTIITGVDRSISPQEQGLRVNPANMAKSLGKSRVLHFKDANAAMAYRDQFGYGNVTDGMIAHFGNFARVASNMRVLGPNPQAMFLAMAKSLERRIRTTKGLDVATMDEMIKGLQTDAGALKHALDISTGYQATPENIKWAEIGENIRNFERMAKLGAALWSSIGDPLTASIAGQFRGNGFFRTFAQQLEFMADTSSDARAMMYLTGEGFDGLLHNVVAAATGWDSRLGMTGKLTELYFKMNGLTWWTDRGRAAAARTVAAELGMRAGTEWAALPEAFKHVLGLNGIVEPHWNAIRQAGVHQVNGRNYITGDLIQDLPLDAMRQLAAPELARATKNGVIDPVREASILTRTRDDLEMAVRRYIADETSYGVIENDARSRRTTTWGTRPGSPAGEAMRFVMQFKGWPITFTQRVLGRQIMGRRAGSWNLNGKTFYTETLPNLGALLGSLTLAGYATMAIKDALAGYWPPRDPGDMRTWIAAIQTGGAWGIYSDFLFGTSNRFGGGLLETLAGPTFGTVGDLWNEYSDARDFAASLGQDKFSAGQAFTTLYGNIPGANLFYVKAGLDYLWLNGLREMLSPGYLRRRAREREVEYGQYPWHPQMAGG